MKKPRYTAGWPDGSGSNIYVYDRKTKKALAVTAWGCSCCREDITPAHTKTLHMIVAALNAAEEKQRGKKKVGPKARRTRVQSKTRR